jgi:hypothetical protein
MECNVGGAEKNVRILTGAMALTLGLFAPMKRGARIAALGIGVIELTTALTGYCPVNQLMGRNTCGLGNLRTATERALQNAQEFAA